ncbi:MAG: hypothetical protein D6714_04800 [Bacteroidetes bacterium]|nr:MAG: hypothetical protein D6714_04800 [Bacteroidota bacterium]
MNPSKEKWIHSVLSSLEGSQRAKPAPRLFDQIQETIARREAPVVPLSWRRMGVAAAAVMLFLNIAALRHYSKTQSETTVQSSEYSDAESLISNYNIYEL